MSKVAPDVSREICCLKNAFHSRRTYGDDEPEIRSHRGRVVWRDAMNLSHVNATYAQAIKFFL